MTDEEEARYRAAYSLDGDTTTYDHLAELLYEQILGAGIAEGWWSHVTVRSCPQGGDPAFCRLLIGRSWIQTVGSLTHGVFPRSLEATVSIVPLLLPRPRVRRVRAAFRRFRCRCRTVRSLWRERTVPTLPQCAAGTAAALLRGAPGAPPLAGKRDDRGMSTAEYALGTVTACAFAAVLFAILTSDEVRDVVTGIVTDALQIDG
ncbi:DUF4244 domain-containing protein [Streptomonospora algeriensis]|uniref:DUF4244 domain-containing protein n=1 Tax=Streptomonospora algeriensis TaxID=995084 RepID=A0ABW3BD38_9ACTN